MRAVTPLSLDVLQQLHPEPRRHLSVQERGRVVLVPVERILYMRAELKYVTLRTAEREHLLEESLTRLEQEFRDRFVRIHRSCLVARDYIDRFERAGEDGAEGGWTVVLRGLDERLPVSRRQQHVIKGVRRPSWLSAPDLRRRGPGASLTARWSADLASRLNSSPVARSSSRCDSMLGCPTWRLRTAAV